MYFLVLYTEGWQGFAQRDWDRVCSIGIVILYMYMYVLSVCIC